MHYLTSPFLPAPFHLFSHQLKFFEGTSGPRGTCPGYPPPLSVGLPRTTRSLSVDTLSRPRTISSLKITDRSFGYASTHLWNHIPDSFSQPRQSCLDSLPYSLVSSSLSSSPLSSAFSIYRPPSIPLTTISYSLVYPLGLAFMALH